MARPSRFSPEVRERAVRMVFAPAQPSPLAPLSHRHLARGEATGCIPPVPYGLQLMDRKKQIGGRRRPLTEW
jgi:hypothetical protein